jgi:hypothetical protein
MWEIHKSGSVRGVKLFYKAEYCGTPQSKERRNREYKVCLNDRTLRLLYHDVTWKSGCFPVPERGDFAKNSGILKSSVPYWLYLESYIKEKGCMYETRSP